MIKKPNIIITDSDEDFEDDSEELLNLGSIFLSSEDDEYYMDLIDTLGDDANLLFDPSWEKDVK